MRWNDEYVLFNMYYLLACPEGILATLMKMHEDISLQGRNVGGNYVIFLIKHQVLSETITNMTTFGTLCNHFIFTSAKEVV